MDRTEVGRKERPGMTYLEELDYPLPRGEKCAHNRGRWMVELGGKVYGFRPATQIQKDIWLGDQEDQTEAIRLLRWYCFECGTLQQP